MGAFRFSVRGGERFSSLAGVTHAKRLLCLPRFMMNTRPLNTRTFPVAFASSGCLPSLIHVPALDFLRPRDVWTSNPPHTRVQPRRPSAPPEQQDQDLCELPGGKLPERCALLTYGARLAVRLRVVLQAFCNLWCCCRRGLVSQEQDLEIHGGRLTALVVLFCFRKR